MNETLGLQKFYREYFGRFFSLTTLLKSLAVVENENVDLKRRFKALLEIWNASTTET